MRVIMGFRIQLGNGYSYLIGRGWQKLRAVWNIFEQGKVLDVFNVLANHDCADEL